MGNSKFLVFIFISIVLILPSISQTKPGFHTKSKKAIKLYEESTQLMASRNFKVAIDNLQKAIKADEDFAEAHYRLGFIYAMNGNNAATRPHFEKVAALIPDEKSIKDIYISLADIYFGEGNYPEAVRAADKYLSFQSGSKGNIAVMELRKASALFAMEAIKKPLNFKPKAMPLAVNGYMRQYFPVLTADEQTLIYTVQETKRANEDIFLSTKLNNQWQKPQSISKKLNTEFNEGTCTISADGKVMIFTSCDGRDGYGKCDLFETYKIGDEWTEPMNLGQGVNSPAWESQPALSADGKTLYFISDRRNGVGARDIYVSKKKNNQWGAAVNLGKIINTPFDEVSPFIHQNDRTLFFSSNGLPGMGGYDLYFSELENKEWTKPENMGYPINTKEEQVSLFVSANGKKGYYTFENQERSVLAEFDMPDEVAPAYRSNYVKGEVIDAETKEKLEATIDLYNISTEELIFSVTSDPVNGEYLMVLTEGAEYALYIRRPGYLFKSYSFNYTKTKNPDPVVINIELDKIKAGAKVVLNNIFFATGKFDLEDKSKTELDKIIEFLELNKAIKIEISGHTDNVGSSQANTDLSLNRAKSVFTHLINSGVAKERLSYKGFGETKPVVPNDTEENKQVNRRIEFKIL